MPRALGCCASLSQGRKYLQNTTSVTSNGKICKAVQNCMQSFALCLSPSPPAAASSLAPSQAVLQSKDSPPSSAGRCSCHKPLQTAAPFSSSSRSLQSSGWERALSALEKELVQRIRSISNGALLRLVQNHCLVSSISEGVIFKPRSRASLISSQIPV